MEKHFEDGSGAHASTPVPRPAASSTTGGGPGWDAGGLSPRMHTSPPFGVVPLRGDSGGAGHRVLGGARESIRTSEHSSLGRRMDGASATAPPQPSPSQGGTRKERQLRQ